MAQYYYHYFDSEGKVVGSQYMTESEVAHLLKYGRVNLWSGYHSARYVAKPRNILVVPTKLARQYDYKIFLALVKYLPTNLDLRIINIQDYPEFFI